MSTLQNDKERLAALKAERPNKSLTKQSFAKQCNINLIHAEYLRTGIMPHEKHEPFHPSQSSGTKHLPTLSFHEAMNQTTKFNQSFYDGSFQPDIPQKTVYTDTHPISKNLKFNP